MKAFKRIPAARWAQAAMLAASNIRSKPATRLRAREAMAAGERIRARPRAQPAPAILLGGRANATSVARSLGRRGVPVVLIARRESAAFRSRYVSAAYTLDPNGTSDATYEDLLARAGELAPGGVLFPCDDEAIEFLAHHHGTLAQHYLLDRTKPALQLALLDKAKTLDLAKAAGCPTPQAWPIRSLDEVKRHLDDIALPILIKPIHSHRFQKRFGQKLFLVHSPGELIDKVGEVQAADIECMLCEYIPGPDALLSSYYVYIDDRGRKLFEMTKRVVRRAPSNFGVGSYHVAEWLPETAAMGEQFFRATGFQGLGNIEFKQDPRDGQLKVMECNARFTSAQELITRSGLDMPYLIHRHLVTGECPATPSTRFGLGLWLPLEDFEAFRELHARGESGWTQWLASLKRLLVFSYFRLDDPGPFLAEARRALSKRLGRRRLNT